MQFLCMSQNISSSDIFQLHFREWSIEYPVVLYVSIKSLEFLMSFIQAKHFNLSWCKQIKLIIILAVTST